MRPSRRIRIRPLASTDRDVVGEVFAGLSRSSRYARYLGAVEGLTGPMLDALSDVDPDRHVVLVAEVGHGRRRIPVGLARYVVDGPARAEIAYEVVDAWQGRGVGTRLARALIAEARRRGLAQVHATVLADNTASLRLLERVLPQARTRRHGDVVEVTAWLVEPPMEAADLLADLHVA